MSQLRPGFSKRRCRSYLPVRHYNTAPVITAIDPKLYRSAASGSTHFPTADMTPQVDPRKRYDSLKEQFHAALQRAFSATDDQASIAQRCVLQPPPKEHDTTSCWA